jgi:tetratricopeptide (TPR) repeat protein
MRIFVLIVAFAAPLLGLDERKLALETVARADFDRVRALSAPDLVRTTACLQSQAMLLSIATPEETPVIAFRKAYCTLAHAVATEDRASYGQAAEVFDDAIADSQAASARQKLPSAVPSTWRILASVARLNGGAATESQEQALARAVDTSDCEASALETDFCRSVHQIGSAWLGYSALERGDAQAAQRRFAASDAPGWPDWVSGVLEVGRGNYTQAAADYGRAIASWRDAAARSLTRELLPKAGMGAMLTDWGGAQLLAGGPSRAIAALDAAIKAGPNTPRAFYLRAIAKERAGRGEAAAEDYDLASRAAFARSGDASAAEANFYRGILLYRRKEFLRAEQEFSTAINTAVPQDLQADARAWRHLSAVAGGACGASREALERALASVSAYFPKQEALATFSACPVTAAALPDK